jgi:hypothetical protein
MADINVYVNCSCMSRRLGCTTRVYDIMCIIIIIIIIIIITLFFLAS